MGRSDVYFGMLIVFFLLLITILRHHNKAESIPYRKKIPYHIPVVLI